MWCATWRNNPINGLRARSFVPENILAVLGPRGGIPSEPFKVHFLHRCRFQGVQDGRRPVVEAHGLDFALSSSTVILLQSARFTPVTSLPQVPPGIPAKRPLRPNANNRGSPIFIGLWVLPEVSIRAFP